MIKNEQQIDEQIITNLKTIPLKQGICYFDTELTNEIFIFVGLVSEQDQLDQFMKYKKTFPLKLFSIKKNKIENFTMSSTNYFYEI